MELACQRGGSAKGWVRRVVRKGSEATGAREGARAFGRAGRRIRVGKIGGFPAVLGSSKGDSA